MEFKIQEKLGVVLQTYNLRTWEALAGELPRVQSLEFHSSLSYKDPVSRSQHGARETAQQLGARAVLAEDPFKPS